MRKQEERPVGQTRDVGFEIGVRRTVDLAPAAAWQLITSDAGIAVWLGKVKDLTLEPGATYRTADGGTGEFRVVKPGSHLRVTWQPGDWPRPSTIQVRVLPSGGRAALSFHQEHLPDAAAREQMQQRWYGVLDHLEALIERDEAARG